MSIPTDPERPARPQYGEYATPEEQRARIKQPDASRALEEGHALTPAPPAVVAPVAKQPSARRPAPASGTVSLAHTDTSDQAVRRRNLDRVVTWMLLGYGLFTVVTQIPSYLDYAGFASSFFSILGVNVTLTDPAGAQVWGTAAAVVLGAGWLLTAVLSWLRMRSGHRGWWVPLVGGVVFTFAAACLMIVPLMTDPAVWPALEKALLPA